MKITQFTDFSLRMLLYLAARRDRVVTIGEIAEFYAISAEHLKKIVRRLSQLGYVTTVRGKNGGVRLACEPEAVNLGMLVRQEENLALLPCSEPCSGCPLEPCKLAGAVDEALAAFLGVLDTRTLADLV